VRRYSAKLLFQWRPVRDGVSRKRRICEERIVTYEARSPKSALTKAKRLGKSDEFKDRQDGIDIFFEFIGVLELLDVTSLPDEEVWWQLVERVQPGERRASIVPAEDQLDVFSKTGPKRSKYCLKAW